VRPRRTRAGRRTRLRFRVTSGGHSVAGAKVRVGRRRATTGARGSTSVVYRFRRSGRVRIRASRAGYLSAELAIRVLRPR